MWRDGEVQRGGILWSRPFYARPSSSRRAPTGPQAKQTPTKEANHSDLNTSSSMRGDRFWLQRHFFKLTKWYVQFVPTGEDPSLLCVREVTPSSPEADVWVSLVCVTQKSEQPAALSTRPADGEPGCWLSFCPCLRVIWGSAPWPRRSPILPRSPKSPLRPQTRWAPPAPGPTGQEGDITYYDTRRQDV